MWESTVKSLNDGRGHQVRILRDGEAVPYREALRGWQNDEAFRSYFFDLLATSPFRAFRWETPPVTTATAGRHFEFVLLDAPGLDRTPDPGAFADRFGAGPAGESVVAFPNLGNDAVLVVPRPAGPPAAYSHLGAFFRHARDSQKHELWRAVGAQMQLRLSDRPVWLSTAGMGVSWLHVRLDARPKYYGFRPYAESA